MAPVTRCSPSTQTVTSAKANQPSALHFLNIVKEKGRSLCRRDNNEEESCMSPLRRRMGDHKPTVQPTVKRRVKQ